MKKQTNLTRIEPNIHLAPLTVFDIGSNKDYLNRGKIYHDMRTTITTKLSTLLLSLQEQNAVPQQLAMPGYVIEHLAQEQPQLIAQLKEEVQHNNIELVTQPYNGTTMHLLDEEDAITEIHKHQSALQKHFGTQAKTLIVDTQPTPQTLKKIGVTSCNIHPNSSEKHTDMQKHLIQELQALHPYIKQMGDEQLLEDFYLLGTQQSIAHIHEETGGDEPYDYYATMMTILNDIAHRIKAVQRLEQGEFHLQTELSQSPSQLLTK